MNKLVRLGAAFLAVSVLPACATVVRGTKTSYKITSAPSEADVALSTGEKCVTPCKLKLKRKHGFTATATKTGYTPGTAQVESKLSGGGGVAAAGNVLAGGIIGGIVDGSNGSLNSLYPHSLHFELRPEEVVAAPVTASAAPVEPVAASSESAPVATPAAATGTSVTSSVN